MPRASEYEDYHLRMGEVLRALSRLEKRSQLELLEDLSVAGTDVVRLLTDASFPGWAAILRAGGTFTWETWTPSDLIGDSMSHGWGSSALVAVQEALVGVVRGMGASTIAEFVGDEETERLLRSFGVDYAQGFQVGYPGPLLGLASQGGRRTAAPVLEPGVAGP